MIGYFFRQRKNPKKGSHCKGLSILLILSLIIGLFTGWAGYYAGSALRRAPAWNSRELASDMTTFIYDRHGDMVAQLHTGENRIPVTIDQIPRHLINAFLAIEDIRFYRHPGVDLKAVLRAAWTNLSGGGIAEGASTISQQLIKNAFLSPEKTFRRKLQEIYLAFQLEQKYTKDEILELYLNRIYFGHGAYGIEAAAETFFGKKVEELTLAEGALLAGIPKSPQRYSPYAHPAESLKRRNLVLAQMLKYGLITPQEEEVARREKVKVLPLREPAYKFPYFVDYVIQEARERKIIDEELLATGGYRIYTTLDPRIQAITEEAFRNPGNFPREGGDQQVEGAMAIIDYHRGEIVALVGGRRHQVKMGFNRATQLRRQPGSTLKPVVAYGPALEENLTAAKVLRDAPIKYGDYSPRNYDGRYRGSLTMRPALKHSVNVYAVKLLEGIGVEKGYAFAKKVGLPLEKADLNYGLALGGLAKGVSPLQMAGAFGSFGNEGIWIEPYAIAKVVDAQGRIIYQAQPRKTRVMSRENAYIMTDLLQEVVKSGTGYRAKMKHSVAGKTGTTQLPDLPEFQGLKGNKDAWFVGYTPQLAAAVWMGFDKTDRKHYLDKTVGGTYPAQLWKKVMEKILEPVPVTEFQEPEGIARIRICSVTGYQAGEDCPSHREVFVKGTEPKGFCRAQHGGKGETAPPKESPVITPGLGRGTRESHQAPPLLEPGPSEPPPLEPETPDFPAQEPWPPGPSLNPGPSEPPLEPETPASSALNPGLPDQQSHEVSFIKKEFVEIG